jgi:hypothetical protein
MLAKLAMTVVVLAMAAACSSGKHTAASTPTPSPSSASSTPITDTPTAEPSPAIDETGRTTCGMLKANRTLQSTVGFIIVAGVVNEGDVLPTVDELQLEASEAPAEFQHGLTSLAAVLQEIDDSLAAGGGDSIDTSSVQPNVNLLVGMCRARGVPIPME